MIARNKSRLVPQGYKQIEGIYFKETSDLISCLESIRLLIGVACCFGIKLYQMDVIEECFSQWGYQRGCLY